MTDHLLTADAGAPAGTSEVEYAGRQELPVRFGTHKAHTAGAGHIAGCHIVSGSPGGGCWTATGGAPPPAKNAWSELRSCRRYLQQANGSQHRVSRTLLPMRARPAAQQLCSHCRWPSTSVCDECPLQPPTPRHFRVCPLQPLTGSSTPLTPRPRASHAFSCCILHDQEPAPQPHNHTTSTPHLAFAAGLSGSAGMKSILCTRSARLSRPGCVADQARR